MQRLRVFRDSDDQADGVLQESMKILVLRALRLHEPGAIVFARAFAKGGDVGRATGITVKHVPRAHAKY